MDRRISKELIPDGRAADQPDSDFDPKQLAQGIQVEMEHTRNKALAKEIAKDHLAEIPDYYTKLIEMERKASDLEPEKINLKERWRNKEWNKLDGAPEEDVLTQPLRSRHDYGESMKVSKKLRKVASYLKTALDDQSPEALHFSLNHDDEEEDFLHSASLHFGQDWERVWKPAWYTVALTTSTAPHSSEGKKFLKETGAHVEKQGGRFLYYLK
jgi:hypothetical protein